jgi:hypothetical protein
MGAGEWGGMTPSNLGVRLEFIGLGVRRIGLPSWDVEKPNGYVEHMTRHR